jgi:hypothetical protein
MSADFLWHWEFAKGEEARGFDFLSPITLPSGSPPIERPEMGFDVTNYGPDPVKLKTETVGETTLLSGASMSIVGRVLLIELPSGSERAFGKVVGSLFRPH